MDFFPGKFILGFAYINLGANGASFYNKHYCIPHNLSAIFTGRNEIIQEMFEGILATNVGKTLSKQKRFVLYGLGGSGKTQACLKFAQDYRER